MDAVASRLRDVRRPHEWRALALPEPLESAGPASGRVAWLPAARLRRPSRVRRGVSAGSRAPGAPGRLGGDDDPVIRRGGPLARLLAAPTVHMTARATTRSSLARARTARRPPRTDSAACHAATRPTTGDDAPANRPDHGGRHYGAGRRTGLGLIEPAYRAPRTARRHRRSDVCASPRCSSDQESPRKGPSSRPRPRSSTRWEAARGPVRRAPTTWRGGRNSSRAESASVTTTGLRSDALARA